MPGGKSSRAIGEELGGLPDEADVAFWEVLERDPLFELRLLAEHTPVRLDLPPNAAVPGAGLAAAVGRLSGAASLDPGLRRAGLDGVFASAVEDVLDREVTRAVLRREPDLGGELRAALARALVAQTIVRADEELGGTVPLDGASREALVAVIVAELGGSDRGLGRFVLDLALRLGMRPVERRRAAISDAAAPAAGDVLMYLARGGPIRDCIGSAVTALDKPVVIIAHSLGGIASLELLATTALPQVEMLVTVGSQAPLLYELNALPTLAFGAELPAGVPRWVNIFDRRDLLAYTAEKIFPGRVEDRHVDNRAPFPRAHSAYFANERFYAVLDEVLP